MVFTAPASCLLIQTCQSPQRAAQVQGQSQNNALLPGLDLLQSLIQILIPFRQFKFVVCADLEGLFLQVGVIPCDKLSLRFLWREGPASEIAI